MSFPKIKIGTIMMILKVSLNIRARSNDSSKNSRKTKNYSSTGSFIQSYRWIDTWCVGSRIKVIMCVCVLPHFQIWRSVIFRAGKIYFVPMCWYIYRSFYETVNLRLLYFVMSEKQVDWSLCHVKGEHTQCVGARPHWGSL